jgi:hypothetical protein
LKLRIQGDSLRLRLTRQEVASLASAGAVECAIHFPGGQVLHYSVVSAGEMGVSYANESIRVALPEAIVKRWNETNEVSIEGSVGSTHVLVEKDFQCLHAEKDRDPDAFQNPTERNH